MVMCKQCGVELDSEMQVCPLCETPVVEGRRILKFQAGEADQKVKTHLLKEILWQIACVLLLSGIVATLTINLSIVGRITWSIYPVSICLIVLSYASLLSFWNTKLIIQLISGWIVSSVVLGVIQWYVEESWPLRIALPIVSAVNTIGIVLMVLSSNLKVKGLNIVAFVFVGVAVICLIIEGILSLYFTDQLRLTWSVVVSACLLPVTAAIIFMFLRTRNSRDLQKIFHT